MALPKSTKQGVTGGFKPLDPALLVCGIAAIAGAVWALWGAGRGPVRASPSPSVAIVRPAYDPNQTVHAIAVFGQKARADKKDWLSLSLLTGFYLQRCRETGDIGDAVRAEQAARRSLSIFARANDGARDQLSMSLLTQHRFSEALSVLSPHAGTSAVADIEAPPQARLLRAEIEMEIGDYEASGRELRAAGSDEAGPNEFALRARLLEINGQPQRALEDLRRAAAGADRNIDMPVSSVAWYHMRIGNVLADLGRAEEAKRAYLEALALFPRDYRTLTALARLAAGRGDWPEVLNWGSQSAAIVPTPEIVALLGDADTALGKPKEAEAQYALVDIIARLAKVQGAIYDRQRALFCADHDRNLKEGLTLARREVQVRHDIYAYDTLAWVCCCAGRLDEARPAMEKALDRGTQDARIYYHAGCLAWAEGDRTHARDYFARALQLNPYFLPFAPQKARALIAQFDMRGS